MSDLTALLDKVHLKYKNSDLSNGLLRELICKLYDIPMGPYSFDEKFHNHLFFITSNEISIWQNVKNFQAKQTEILCDLLTCLQISFAKSTDDLRLQICQNDEYMGTLVDVLNNAVKEMDISSSEIESSVRHEYVVDCSNIGSSCAGIFCNLMARHPENRKLVWPHIKPHLQNYLQVFSTLKQGHVISSILHHFLLCPVIKVDLLSAYDLNVLVNGLLNLYLISSPHSCFTLFCLEILFCESSVLHSCWSLLDDKMRLLTLDILVSVVQKERSNQENIPRRSFVQMLTQEYKKAADQILSTKNTELSYGANPQLVSRILSFLSAAAASDNFSEMLQSDTSLLISSSYLLKAMKDTKTETEYSHEKDINLETNPPDSFYGFKSQLIRFIATLVYKHKINQDTVRECKTLEDLLENSQLDVENPLIKEMCMYALRNAVEGNVESQEYLKNYEVKEVLQNSSLTRLGLSVDLQNGKPVLSQIHK